MAAGDDTLTFVIHYFIHLLNIQWSILLILLNELQIHEVDRLSIDDQLGTLFLRRSDLLLGNFCSLFCKEHSGL